METIELTFVFVGMLAVNCSGDAGLFAAWMIIGLIGSFLFIFVQLILIIDFSHAWNGAWLDRYDDSQNKCWLIGKQLLLWLVAT